ncbi:ankyrin repeat-containing protein [Orientia tsutsugamushi str. Kato PP]|nr:ankyrin repeat-containing protein [Orientia tsutsugamushi str. Kato PP]
MQLIKDDFHLFKFLVKSRAEIDTVDAFGNLPIHYLVITYVYSSI